MMSKEKTMLKWLKQKPSSSSSSSHGGGSGAGILGGGHGALPIEKITDDPLATIQVHPHAKKNKNKANEIYAVSRVNPLFEEEDVKEVFSPGGHSGSSGYDSGSGPSDDDFPIIHNLSTDLKDLQQNLLGRLGSPNIPQTNSVVQTAATSTKPSASSALAHPQLFINTENDVIHHETAIVGPNGRPILQILEQNPAYVKSIALAVGSGRKRPLSPISEGTTAAITQKLSSPPPQIQSKYNLSTSGSLYNKDATKRATGNNYTTIDSIGNAKLVKKDSQYVRSIRIGGPTNFNPSSNNPATKRSILEANRRYSSGSSSSASSGIPPSRRPSVTFADDVGGGSSRSGSRKPSMEQDSIVTESLLMMTSVGGTRFSNAGGGSASSSRKTSFSSNQSKSQDESGNGSSAASTVETDLQSPGGADPVDLEAFANSLRKSRPIKQFNGRPGSADELGDEDDDDIDSGQSSKDPGSSDGYPEDTVHVVVMTPPPMDRISTLDRPGSVAAGQGPTSPRIHTNKKSSSHKSPFGGIADHYAAAKEIAKEIESYSNGSAKASTKKSLVRDLLYRGNRNSTISSNYDHVNLTTSIGTGGKNGFRTGSRAESRILQSPQLILPPPPPQLSPPDMLLRPVSSSTGNTTGRNRTSGKGNGNNQYGSTSGGGAGAAAVGNSNDWELVRVQQVFIKASSGGIQDQQPQPTKQSKKDIAAAMQVVTSGHQGQDHNISTNSRRHHHSSSSTSSKIPTASSTATRAKAAKKVPSSSSSSSAADDGLASTPGARSRNLHQNNNGALETDSGNSSDRTYAEVRLEIEGTKIDLNSSDHRDVIPLTDARIQVECGSPGDEPQVRPENLPSKVMIVTGDSQNIVVDLSGVPLDLKNAIVSGTALITLPDGLDTMLQPGYTMITIPASSANGISASSSRPMSPKSTISHHHHNPHHHRKKDPGGSGGGVMNIAIGLDDDKPLVNNASRSGNGIVNSSSGSDDECKLFSTKNKAQIWDVIQKNLSDVSSAGGVVGGNAGGGGKGKKKITTIFPFHPNQDAYESPDFTIEGHRMDRQRKKVEKEKSRRCACRLCGMLFFLMAFLGVLVALSMIYTKGQRYFGSSV